MTLKTKKKVCVVGLGRIGLPLACLLATSGYDVLGVDIDDAVLDRIKCGHLRDPELGLQDSLLKAIRSSRFEVSNNIEMADIYVIAVPTFLGPNNQPDISAVSTALESLKHHLRPNNLVIIESTCPIGTTLTATKNLRSVCPDVHVAYCPERVLPGNLLHELLHNNRVVGGVDEASTQKAATFYRSFIQGDVSTTNAQTAEAVKLAENAYRDVNIAFANELSMIADRLNLDVHEWIRLANLHPRVKILNPGPGVGGHCIAIDPWYLVGAAPDLARLTRTAREVNNQKTEWVIQKIREEIRKNNARVVACLGLTYKPNVSDLRESPALAIVERLEKEIKVVRVDPYIPCTIQAQEAIKQADIVVKLVAHSPFANIPSEYLAGKIVLDFAQAIR